MDSSYGVQKMEGKELWTRFENNFVGIKILLREFL